MKISKLFLALIAFLAFTYMQAEPNWSTSPYSEILTSNEDPKPVALTKALSLEISTIMDFHEFEDLTEDLLARVVFTINNNNEIVVLYVLSDNRNVDYFVKNKLNYKKLHTNAEKGIYHMPLRITPETRESLEYKKRQEIKKDKKMRIKKDKKFKKYQV